MLGLLMGPVAKIGFPIVLAFALYQHVELNGLFWQGGVKGERDDLYQEIHGPINGYIVRLNTARANTAACQTALDQSNAESDARAAESDARLAQAENALAEARASNIGLQRRIGVIMATEPTDDLCMSADALIVEAMR